MLVPICCFSCGMYVGDKWIKYQDLVLKAGGAESVSEGKLFKMLVPSEAMLKTKTPEQIALDKLGLMRYCCRRTMLGTQEILPIID
jgi:DNA-directed RNA polymerase subunit N (RpoN/RPB10)